MIFVVIQEKNSTTSMLCGVRNRQIPSAPNGHQAQADVEACGGSDGSRATTDAAVRSSYDVLPEYNIRTGKAVEQSVINHGADAYSSSSPG
ncbi:hypothetical protein EDC30_101371 [Paucimonas lemoignei]|uniref:Uncharacterized protein n=1 Tax=Paucimonas lemoignei TaxID=29443 RepID=A0A4R3I3X8_PAULE|nr:hypothetical protein EDC30_101371 [Paucimonas lemoignei]